MSTHYDTYERMSALVHEVIAQIVPGVSKATISGDMHLRDLGADSVDRVEIILLLLERLGRDEPLSSFSDLPDLDAMVEFLVRMGTA